MLTLCWGAKGGSGTTVVAAGLALARPGPTLFVDLAGDAPDVLGVAPPELPGVHDWLASEAPAERLAHLEIRLGDDVALIQAGGRGAAGAGRWSVLAEHLSRQTRQVVVDAGTAPPPPELVGAADHVWLVTRNCYLALRSYLRRPTPVTGVVLVAEPGRRLGAAEVEHTTAAPVVATVPYDPAIARAVDAGLLLGRVPAGLRGPLAGTASHRLRVVA